MGYLAPPPMPAPVIVTKDVGGFLSDYQAQTAIYRATGREVRLRECRSACTLALSLPNVCVYPDSVLKFHQAYDPRSRQANYQASQQLFDSYPAAVRARLGTLTREYRVLRGAELIALGIRNCSEPRVMVATAAPRKAAPQRAQAASAPAAEGSVFDDLMQNVLVAFGQLGGTAGEKQERVAALPPGRFRPGPAVAAGIIPLPPERPASLGATIEAGEAQAVSQDVPALATSEGTEVPVPPQRPEALQPGSPRRTAWDAPVVISGAQAILPARFTTPMVPQRS